jgi:hypothetical protein
MLGITPDPSRKEAAGDKGNYFRFHVFSVSVPLLLYRSLSTHLPTIACQKPHRNCVSCELAIFLTVASYYSPIRRSPSPLPEVAFEAKARRNLKRRDQQRSMFSFLTHLKLWKRP